MIDINKLQANNRDIGNGLETTCLHHFGKQSKIGS